MGTGMASTSPGIKEECAVIDSKLEGFRGVAEKLEIKFQLKGTIRSSGIDFSLRQARSTCAIISHDNVIFSRTEVGYIARICFSDNTESPFFPMGDSRALGSLPFSILKLLTKLALEVSLKRQVVLESVSNHSVVSISD
jgi:hypothetical protein